MGGRFGGHQVSVVESLAIIGGFGLAMNALAMWLVSLREWARGLRRVSSPILRRDG